MSEIRVNNIIDEAGTGAPTFPNGAIVTGSLVATATTATTATNATGLSGTPNITVGTVTGTDATFSGNLTVNGTTTTIDTAVTSVDSLAVDGLTSSSGFQANGNTTPSTGSGVEVFQPSATEGRIQTYDRGGSAWMDLRLKGQSITLSSSSTDAVSIPSTGGMRLVGGLLEEKFEQRSGDIGDDANFNVLNGNVLKYTGAANAAGARTINIRGNASTTFNAITAVGHVSSMTILHRPNSNDYINAYTVDGNANGQNSYTLSTEFLGGSAPSAASAADLEVHNISVFKNADKNFTILVAVSEYS